MWLRSCVDRALDRCEKLLWNLILLVTGITFAMKSARWALDRLRAKNPILRLLLEPCSAGLDRLEAGLKAAAPIPRSERQAEKKVESKPGPLACWLKVGVSTNHIDAFRALQTSQLIPPRQSNRVRFRTRVLRMDRLENTSVGFRPPAS